MGFKFRKSIKVAPGVKINVTHKGVGVSAGVKGASISTGPSGSRITTSLPGTGISYEQRIGKKRGPKQRTSSSASATQNTTTTTPNNRSHTRGQSSPIKKEVKAFIVTPFRSKDNEANSFARKLMKPLSIITGVCAILFLIMMLVIPALILAAISFLCYKNIKTPFAAVCPECNAENLIIFKEEKLACRTCKSTLIIQK
ncbi:MULTISPECIES: DUF4236 domain-containing protein [Bacillus cereus group]|uniref:DUF4236 domain-containing protein n=3 Tax=Bacillus thuringiensis TaxID=1428 RepID=A0A1W6WYT8_BACTU|nr:DUF4236 domain-containing protein [Bacillus thuringiensis]MEC2877579.1 DUF4236 domain-containing protein [Bacillus cereus]AEA19658.1 hypothetical protein CT43_P51042 [Bacillus thuringiensis serovar chinensis CT-43]AGG04424.1 hypothetical protein H175_39p10 [Bacillus thuringiensis serovar thuringiensis str. IS5056]ARP61704.1 hypothetical protein CAB88_32385 [Bacillus thuringiensis]AST05358.1 hypothetical protein BT10792_33620 [Bacillus thuringiensis]